MLATGMPIDSTRSCPPKLLIHSRILQCALVQFTFKTEKQRVQRASLACSQLL